MINKYKDHTSYSMYINITRKKINICMIYLWEKFGVPGSSGLPGRGVMGDFVVPEAKIGFEQVIPYNQRNTTVVFCVVEDNSNTIAPKKHLITPIASCAFIFMTSSWDLPFCANGHIMQHKCYAEMFQNGIQIHVVWSLSKHLSINNTIRQTNTLEAYFKYKAHRLKKTSSTKIAEFKKDQKLVR